MVSAVLRSFGIVAWAVVAPIAVFAFEVRLTQFWDTRLNVDLFLSILIGLAALAGGAALLLFLRLSPMKRIGAFVGYWLFASVILFLLYPTIVCSAVQCP